MAPITRGVPNVTAGDSTAPITRGVPNVTAGGFDGSHHPRYAECRQ